MKTKVSSTYLIHQAVRAIQSPLNFLFTKKTEVEI